MNGVARKIEYELGGLGLATSNTPEEIIGASMAKGEPGGCVGGWHLSAMAVMVAASIENQALRYRMGQLCDLITQIVVEGPAFDQQPDKGEILTMLQYIKAGDTGLDEPAPVQTLPADDGDESPTAARLRMAEPVVEPDLENAEREYQAQLRRVQAVAEDTIGWNAMIRFVFPNKRSVASSAKELRPGELALVEVWIEKHAATAAAKYDGESERRFDA